MIDLLHSFTLSTLIIDTCEYTAIFSTSPIVTFDLLLLVVLILVCTVSSVLGLRRMEPQRQAMAMMMLTVELSWVTRAGWTRLVSGWARDHVLQQWSPWPGCSALLIASIGCDGDGCRETSWKTKFMKYFLKNALWHHKNNQGLIKYTTKIQNRKTPFHLKCLKLGFFI